MGGSQEQIEYDSVLVELVNKIVLAIAMEAELPHKKLLENPSNSSGIEKYDNFLYKWSGKKGTIKNFKRNRRLFKTGGLAVLSATLGVSATNLISYQSGDNNLLILGLLMVAFGVLGFSASGVFALTGEYDNFWLSKKTKQKWERTTSEEHKEKVLKKFEDNLTVLPLYEDGGVFSYNPQPNNLIQND